jgi:hypothetical protein
MTANESLVSRRKVGSSSDRAFGFVFAVVFGIVGVWPLLSGGAPRLWALVTGLAFLAVAMVYPTLLGPLNRLWRLVGLALHHVVNPAIMGFIYFLAVVPIGLLLRARGKDLLRLRRDPTAQSYWIERTPPGPPSGSMSKQF